MTSHPALPAVSMSGAYLADAITDEVALAELLGWTVSGAPVEITPSVTLWGSKGHTFAASSGMSVALGPSTFLPKWRRSWAGAGELIGRCNLCVMFSGHSVLIGQAGEPFTVEVLFADHPSKDHAIWAAMCKAAIAYLTAESSTTKAAP